MWSHTVSFRYGTQKRSVAHSQYFETAVLSTTLYFTQNYPHRIDNEIYIPDKCNAYQRPVLTP